MLLGLEGTKIAVQGTTINRTFEPVQICSSEGLGGMKLQCYVAHIISDEKRDMPAAPT